MVEPRKILIVSSEMTPYAKTGGLADVTGALAHTLRARGHDVRVVIPLYQCVLDGDNDLHPLLGSMCVHMGNTEEWCSVLEMRAPGELPVYCIQHDNFFMRPELYHDAAMNDYGDNPWRYAFFCRAALQLCMDTGFEPDIVHANDWQTAPITAYLKVWFWEHPALGAAASILTIHNIAYQGNYPVDCYPYMGLGVENFHADAFESHGRVNFLKGGVYFADAVNTVSPGFAREIVQPFQGFGLAPYLNNKGHAFRGILNGVDYRLWNPATDKFLPANYDSHDMQGKSVCKRDLQREFGLEEREDIPLFGVVGRFTAQKGFDLLRGSIEEALDSMDMQFIILGSGEPDLSTYFGELPARHPGRAASYIGYSDRLAHRIEAASDFFLMPSIFEPCGLNQMYSLRYGTLPVVRATGGLDDTVSQYDETTGEGTGFKFYAATPGALRDSIGWAVSTWYDRPEHIQQMRQRGMAQDFSWEHAAEEYEAFYDCAREEKQRYDRSHDI